MTLGYQTTSMIYLFSLLCGVDAWDGLNTLVVSILNQNIPHQIDEAAAARAHISSVCISKNISSPKVHLVHEDFRDVHYWTIFPLLPKLAAIHGRNASWFLFAPETLRIRPDLLLTLLNKFNPDRPVFLGRELRDAEPTIIHHFAFHEKADVFPYPDLTAGVIMSVSLLNSLSERYVRSRSTPVDFSIDPGHELALYVWQEGVGTGLVDPGHLCAAGDKDGPDCATYQRPRKPCTGEVDLSSVHFAVKTCEKFHRERLPVVQQTWALDTDNIVYYSDVTDAKFGTVSVGVPNTERGHCAKTLAILRRSRQIAGLRWLAVVDDDTLISVRRLLEELRCYSAEDPLLLGERYGYKTSGPAGYSYITGGGGMVFSVAAVRRLVGTSECHCPSVDTPDDMHLGLCSAAAGVQLVHSPNFHQARPPDYPARVLAGQRPVSFHKHWAIDPLDVYTRYLQMELPDIDTETGEQRRRDAAEVPPGSGTGGDKHVEL